MSNYKKFGKALLSLWIIFLIFCAIVFFLQINIIKNITTLPFDFITNKTLFPFYGNENMLYAFIGLTILFFVFSLVHGIYIFSKRKEASYTKKSEKDILNTTMAGYCLIVGAYTIFIVFSLAYMRDSEVYTNFGTLFMLSFMLFMIIGVVLLSVGLSQIHEKDGDKKMKELKSVSIMSPIFSSIIGIIYGIVPLCSELFKIVPDKITSVNNPLLTELKRQTNQMKVMNAVKSLEQKAIKNIEAIKNPKTPL